MAEEAVDPVVWQREGFSWDQSKAISKCAHWATTFPLQRVKKKRRQEAICPMVAPSLADRSLRFAASQLRSREPDFALLDEQLRAGAERFETEIDASDPRLRCLVLVLPGVRGALLLEATAPERTIKNELLRRGILVGEFFPSCPLATTFNRRLFALRSPAPMYVFRTFLETDWRFVCQVPAWRETYRERFGEPPSHLRHMGGPWWSLKQKVAWRYDTAENWIRSRLDRLRDAG